jgi:hypothetical protein
LEYEKKFEVNQFIKKGLKENSKIIFEKSQELTPEQREYLFGKFKKDHGLAILFGILPGFGIGLYSIGDVEGGTFALVTDVIAYVALFATMQYRDSLSTDWEMALFFSSAAIWYTSLFYQLFRPEAFVKKYNNQLKESLRLSLLPVPYVHIAQITHEPIYGAVFTAHF